MASFDFDSAMAGAQTGGSVGGPYGAIAGFVISGFMGGSKKKKMKQLAKKKQKRLQKLASPQHLADVTRQLTPLMRQDVAGGAGAELQQAIQTGVARRGLTGTGIGTALTAGASAVPEVMAFKMALGKSGDIVERQIGNEMGRAYGSQDNFASQVGQFGDAVQLFKSLSAESGGPAGGLTPLAPGEYDRREAEAASNATEEFGNQDFDFSAFRPRR